nr:hypothetical protein Itr_chr07CG11930 [Ipomoea trifida]
MATRGASSKLKKAAKKKYPRSNMWLLLLKTPHSSAAATAFPLQNPQVIIATRDGSLPAFPSSPNFFQRNI